MTHTLRRRLPLLIVSIGLAGCSSTRGNRLALAPDFKTVATVGDQPIVAVTGEPGDSVKTDLPTTPNRDNPKTRISGRVVDSAGEPVPNATVRLADGSSGGGKVVEAVTDRAGGFTLRGLRPGGRYTLIAEVDDGRIVTSGRTEAKSSATNVEISLNDSDPDAPPAPKAPRPRSVSSAQSSYDDGLDRPKRRRVNEDDLPPADPADELTTRTSARSDEPGNRVRRAAPGNGWVGADGRTAATRDEPSYNDEIQPREKAAPRSMELIPEEEDVPNPLPPALEPDQGEEEVQVAPTSRRTSRVDPDFPSPARIVSQEPREQLSRQDRPPGGLGASRLARNDDEPVDGEGAFELPGSMRPAAKPPVPRVNVAEPEGEPVRRLASSEPAPPAPPEEEEGPNPLPPALEVSEAPTLTASAPAGAQPGDVAPPEMPAPSAPAPTPAAAPPEPVPPPEWVTDSAGAGRDAAPAKQALAPTAAPKPVADAREETNPLPPAMPARKKTTWGELAAIEPTGPVADRISRSSAAPRNSKLPPVDRDLPDDAEVAETSRSATPRPEMPRSATPRPEPTAAPASRFEKATVLYDPRAKRVSDFTLPDLQGQMVKLSEFDAEYVLLDFWGTWCKPCLNSVPKLIELQKKFGPEKLQIVGIACEESPIPQRAGKVSEVAERLNINYAVLLSGMDGRPCPLQQALGVTAFPTMVLLDRKGNVVWRDSGNSSTSLARLDRIVQSGTARASAGIARR